VAHRNLASRPLWRTGARRRGCNRERGGPGDPGSGLTEARAVVQRPGDGNEETAEEELGVGSARAQEEEKEREERCSGGRLCSPFI
jgi:hypothetical protein